MSKSQKKKAARKASVGASLANDSTVSAKDPQPAPTEVADKSEEASPSATLTKESDKEPEQIDTTTVDAVAPPEPEVEADAWGFETDVTKPKSEDNIDDSSAPKSGSPEDAQVVATEPNAEVVSTPVGIFPW